MNPVEILDGPVTDSAPVAGVCEGRQVAYWPSDYDAEQGLRACGCGGYIPATITANWGGPASPMPAVNLELHYDGLNTPPTAPKYLGSRLYSAKPAKGCWTWIPKA
jgi:hypothetical protein